MLNLIKHDNGLTFETVQLKYVDLENLLKSVKMIRYYAFKANDYIFHPSKAEMNSSFRFD